MLDEIDLDIEPGMTVGLLGPSGAGKSTLLALAPRLYDVPDGLGDRAFDGHDVRDLRLADLRRAVALVPQQALLFEGTIRSNLAYARPEATDRQLWDALEAADLADTVAALPGGLDTPVGERGLSLSGGQRQRLSPRPGPGHRPRRPAARRLHQRPRRRDRGPHPGRPRDVPLGRTLLIVSHKVSSVRHADLIVVLEAGRIVEQGTHDELIARPGPYAETFHAQTHALASV